MARCREFEGGWTMSAVTRVIAATAVLLGLAAPASAETSGLRTLPVKAQKGIEGIRAECRRVAEQATSGDEGLTTFTLSGAQAVLVDELELCAGGQCIHGVNCATGYSHHFDLRPLRRHLEGFLLGRD
jgi:hypothetical protein